MMLFLAVIEHEQDRNKVEAIYKRYSKDMFRVAFRILKDYLLAQDAVQSVMHPVVKT